MPDAAATSADDLRAVLAAASDLLGARQDGMLTVQEWADLARAVARATGRKASDLMAERDLRAAAECGLAWDPACDGPLPGADDL